MTAHEIRADGFKVWQLFLGQVPWVLTLLAMGAAAVTKFDVRLTALERAVARIEVRQEKAAEDQLKQLTEEIARARRAVGK